MSIEFHYTDSSKLLRVADGVWGKRCKCPSCSSVQTVPIQKTVPQATEIPSAKKPSNAAGHPPKPSRIDESIDIKIEIACPKCESLLLYSPELEGTQPSTFACQCPKCSFLFEGKKEMDGKKGKCTECKEVFIIQPIKKDVSSKGPSVLTEEPSKSAFEAPQQPAVASSKLFNPLNPASAVLSKSTTTTPSAPHPLFLEPLQEPGQPKDLPIVVNAIPVESVAATPHARVVQAQPVIVTPAAIPIAAKPATTKPSAAMPAIPIVPATANATTSNTNSASVWDQIDVPTPAWTTTSSLEPSSLDRNPYAPPSASSSTSMRSYGRALTITNCLRMVKKRIGPILRWSLVPGAMMIGIAIAEFVLAILGGIGGLVMIEYKEAELYVRIISGAISFFIGIATLPVQMQPIALVDRLPVGHAIHVTHRYVFENFRRFAGWSSMASLIFWALAVLIFVTNAIVFATTGAGMGSAIGAIVFSLAMVIAGLVAFLFFPGFYVCYAAFYAIAKESGR